MHKCKVRRTNEYSNHDDAAWKRHDIHGGNFLPDAAFFLPLGLLVALGRMSKNGLVRGISKFYISIMRGTPLMLQLLVVYFAPYYLLGLNLRGYRFPAIILAFAINYAAYFAEIYRGGIESISVGQYEAAEVLGYNKVRPSSRSSCPR